VADHLSNYGGPSPIGPSLTGPQNGPHPTFPPAPPLAGPALVAPSPGPTPPQAPAGWQPGLPPSTGNPFSTLPSRSLPWWHGRKPLLVTLGAGAAVLVVVAIVLAATLTGRAGGPGGGSAGDTVKGYLEALSRGDAEAALAFSDGQPASKEFLTDEILRKQIAQWPISNIRILGDDAMDTATFGFSRVHVAVNFGEKVSDVQMSVKKNNGKWRIDAAAVKFETRLGGLDDAATRTLTVFGKPVGDGVFYVFPGYLQLGSSNPYIDVKAEPPLLDKLASYAAGIFQSKFSINAAGDKAINDAVSQAFAACQQSSSLAPPAPCPTQIRNFNGELVDGTVKWGQPDLGAIKQSFFDQYKLEVHIMGEARIPVTAQNRGGGVKQADVTAFVSGTVDLSKTPPMLNLR